MMLQSGLGSRRHAFLLRSKGDVLGFKFHPDSVRTSPSGEENQSLRHEAFNAGSGLEYEKWWFSYS